MSRLRFVLFSCSNQDCDNRSSKPWKSKPCHHFRIVFTDGACLDNGGSNARVGAGVAAGATGGFQLSIPITDEEDPFPVRSNQRAELIAAKEELKFMGLLAELNEDSAVDRSREDAPVWTDATDPEYVVRGMTEWYRHGRYVPIVTAKYLKGFANREYRGETGVPQKAPHR